MNYNNIIRTTPMDAKFYIFIIKKNSIANESFSTIYTSLCEYSICF